MKARLIERGEKAEQTREIPLTEEEFLIGRGPDCDLRLRVDSVSRHHCMIRFAGAEATIADLGSSNGTYVNGTRVRSQITLHSGDELQIGVCRFLVELGDREGIDIDTAVGIDPFTSTVKLPKKGPLKSAPAPEATEPPDTPKP